MVGGPANGRKGKQRPTSQPALVCSGWALALYVENLFDDEYYDSGNGMTSASSPYVQSDIGPSRPRTVGLRFTYGL